MKPSVDRLHELEILVAVVDAGSLTGAARRLGRSAPSITRALASLEERTGVRLVERTTRRLAPTDVGRELAEHGRRLVSDYEGALTATAAGPLRGLLRITAPVVFGRRHVTPIVSSFLQKHPEMQIDLVLHDRNIDLIDERVQVAIRIGQLKDSGLLVRKVGEVRRVLVASPAYIRARGTPQRVADLRNHDIVSPTGANAVDEWLFGAGSRAARVRVAPRLRVNEVEAALLAVRADGGIARVLSYQVADELAEGRLLRLLPTHEPDPIPVQIVVPSGRAMAAKVRAFLNHAVQCLAVLPHIQDRT